MSSHLCFLNLFGVASNLTGVPERPLVRGPTAHDDAFHAAGLDRARHPGNRYSAAHAFRIKRTILLLAVMYHMSSS